MKKILKAGAYYIGDPCYVYNNEHPQADSLWREFCDKFYELEKKASAVINVDGADFFVGDTSYGDGTYIDNYGREYGVDSGTIGITLAEIKEKEYFDKMTSESGGHFIAFEKDFEAEINNGIFIFGHIKINTSRDDEEE